MIGPDMLERIVGSTVYDRSGAKIGPASDVYLGDRTGEPEWLTVRTGLFGTGESFVPIRGADLSGDGVRVRVTKDQVEGAPPIEADGHLSPEEEDELHRYYGDAADAGPAVDAQAVLGDAPEERDQGT